MSTNINWANPVFDVKTSQNYLARLQEFLATQQPGGSNSTSNDNNKRKAPSTADEVDTAAAIKDRKHGASRSIDHATHSHTKEGSSERESPEVDEKDGKARSGKGSTSDKRKEQNRNAQRAFRERKEKVLRDLEGQISELQKANETTVSENQNLKEMITRLQEENAKLRQTTSAPQSDFTFSVPSASSQTTAPAFAAPASTASKGPSNPASYNNNDIMTFLSSNPTPPQPTQTPFTMINPSPPPNNNNNANPTNMNSIDDFMMNWNSSAFGTELPQAVPPSVTNLTEQPADTDFASLWNSLNQGNTSTFATVPSQETRQQNLTDNSNFFSLFQNAFTPSLDGQAPASNTNPSFSQYVNSANTAPYNTQSVQNMAASLFPFANASASSSASPSNASNGNSNTNLQHQNSMNSTRNGSSADSPETCASSTSGGSDPSDAQPSTPNNGQALFGNNNNNNKAKSKSGDSVQSLYPDIGLTSFNTSKLSNNNTGSTFEAMFGNNGFGSATTPSGVFDMMNYRDPLLGNLNDAPASGDAFNFGSFIPGNGNVSGSSAGVNNNKRSDTLDFSDFLVASPPSTTQSPPVNSSFFQMPGNNAKESNSSSSLPTLGSLSNGPSPVSTQPSPQTSLNTASTSTGNTSANGTPNWLPYDIPYSHPLIQHVMKGQVNKDKQDFENGMQSIPRQNSNDIDGLCSDMQMKATCKEHARERIAAALQTDEQTMKLYNEYLASAGQNLQQTPSPNVNYTNSA